MWRACEHFHIVPAVHAAQHAWEPVWLHGVDITLGTAKANPTNMTMIPRIDKCSPVPKPRHQVQVVGVGFLDMATCEVCGDGFADDAEKHLCSPSRDSCSHVCHADCLQQYRLKQGCPMHDCPFCLQNEDSQEEADDAALQEMEIEAAMEAEAVAEGVKRKTREEAASPVRAGGGPAGKKLATNASPPAGQRSPVPPTQRSPSPESPPFTQGGSEAARLSIPSFGIDIYDLSRTSKASTTMKDPMHDAMSEYLACRDEAQSLSLLHTKSTYQGLGSPEASYQTVLNAALKDPRDHHAVASDFAFRTREVLPVPFEVSLRTIARKEGWEPETFMAPILSNIGWMEHPCRHAASIAAWWGAPTWLRSPDCLRRWPQHAQEFFEGFYQQKASFPCRCPCCHQGRWHHMHGCHHQGYSCFYQRICPSWHHFGWDCHNNMPWHPGGRPDTQVCITGTKKRCALGWTAKMTRQSLEMVPRRWLITPSFTKCMDRCRFVSMCSSRLQACFPRESMRRGKQGQWQVTLISRASPAKSSWLTSFIKWGAWQATRTKTTILTSSPCPCSGRLCRESPTSFTRITRM